MNIWNLYISTLVFVFGTVIGSFLNVCIYRIPEKLSVVTPRSRCGNCGTTLTGKDLVPILSWLFLKGRCRHCGIKITSRYLWVELTQGLLFVSVFYVHGFSLKTPLLWILTAFLTVVFFIDFDHQRIPNKLVLTGLLLGLIPATLHVFHKETLYPSTLWFEPILGLLIPFLLMLSMAIGGQVVFRKDVLGMGDVKVFAPIGLFLGWQLSLATIWFAYVLGGIFGLFWILIMKKDKNAMISFGPFIACAAYLIGLFSEKVLHFIL